MNVRLEKNNLRKVNITAITSKSYVHRLLIAAALSEGGCTIRSNIVSKDMEATVRVLTEMGAEIEIKEDGTGILFIVRKGIGRGIECALDCGESGSTARFILPVALASSMKAKLTGSGKLPGRPMGDLVQVLREHGGEIDSEAVPLYAKGQLSYGDYRLPGNVSSQYITGLLFALPLLGGDSRIILTSGLESSDYVKMTVDVLTKFGVSIICNNDTYVIKGNQKYVSVPEITAEGDWSNGGYLLCMGFLSGNIDVDGLNMDSIQGDRAVFEILSQFNEGPVSVDGRNIPDIIPALCMVAAYTEGMSVFRNVERLRIKECDRIDAVINILSLIGVRASSCMRDGHEDLYVTGKGRNADKITDVIRSDSYNDHRMVMCLSMIAFMENCPVIIERAEAVNKSYPGFFDVIEETGIRVTKE